MITGDPTIDAIIAWLTDGGKLTSAVAAAAIAAIVRWILLPLAKSVMEKLSKPLSEQSKVYLAYVLSVIVAVVIGLFDKSGTSISTAIAIGLAAGAMSIGIHQTGKVPTQQGTMLQGVMAFATPLRRYEPGTALLPEEHTVEEGKGEGTLTDAPADPPPVGQ